jgi:hypothetical protein
LLLSVDLTDSIDATRAIVAQWDDEPVAAAEPTMRNATAIPASGSIAT